MSQTMACTGLDGQQAGGGPSGTSSPLGWPLPALSVGPAWHPVGPQRTSAVLRGVAGSSGRQVPASLGPSVLWEEATGRSTGPGPGWGA